MIVVVDDGESLPSLQQRYDTTHEEQPHTPAWSPESTARTLTNRACVEAVIDQTLQVLGHADLPHELKVLRQDFGKKKNGSFPTLYL